MVFPTGTDIGKIEYRNDSAEEYIEHSIQSVPVELKGRRIVVDL